MLSLGSCFHPEPQNRARIRGKIVNPRTDQVIISSDFLSLTADTLPLHYENEIKGEVKCPEEGLYFIAIFPEYQTIYLKPGDSLSFHINLDEFDESLSFSGTSGFENNLLIDLYLLNEKESAYFYDHRFNFEADDFLQKIDSFSAIKDELLNGFQSELKETTPRYRKILDLYHQSLQYSLKEAYLKKHPNSIVKKDFENYCKVLRQKLPDPNIIYMYAFADNYIERKIARKNPHSQNPYWEIGHTIDREIYDPRFKDNLLVKYCRRYIKEQQITCPDSVIDHYFGIMQNSLYKKHCQKLIKKNKRLSPTRVFPKIMVRNRQNQKQNLSQILTDSKTLIAFWDLNWRKNFISNLNKLKKIQEKYPELPVIILNTNPDSFDEWTLQLPVNSNFTYLQMTRKDDVKLVKPYHLAQVFLIRDTIISQSFINMYEPGFEKKLTDFLSEN